MDKLNPQLQDTPLIDYEAAAPSYITEATGGWYSDATVAWMMAQGWRPTKVTRITDTDGNVTTFYVMQRKVVDSQATLTTLIGRYNQAFNEGRQLNDQRYDDLVVLYTAILDKTEDTFNTLEADDATWEAATEVLIGAIETDHTAYDADLDDELDTYGTSQTDDINTRFDAELSKGKQSLIDRGVYSTTLWTTMSAGIERERARALADLQDKITLQKVQVKNQIHDHRVSSRARVIEARERLRSRLRDAQDRHVEVRNAVASALASFVERRTDSYPDLAEAGKITALLGGGSASFSP